MGVARHSFRILEQTYKNGLLAHADRDFAMARYPHRVTETFAFTFLIRLDRHRAPASRVSIHNPRQLDPGNSPGATASEVNAAKDTRIGDFGDRLGEARIGTRAWTYFGGEAECGVLSKCGSQDERGGATIRGMRRRILGMRRSTGQRIQQWPPIGVGVSRCGTRSDRLGVVSNAQLPLEVP